MTAGRFVMTYDLGGAQVPEVVVTAFVKSNKFILQWAYLFSGTYLLKSESKMEELMDSFNEFFETTRFFIHRVESTGGADWNGRLPNQVWQWFSLKNEDDSAVLKLN